MLTACGKERINILEAGCVLLTKIGIMQGRLVPPEPGHFQAFPRDRWADEFALAAQVPLSYIEMDLRPLWGRRGNPLTYDVRLLQSVIAGTGVAVRSLCAD